MRNMQKADKFLKAVRIICVILAVCLYVVYMYLDLKGIWADVSVRLKYVSIIICALASMAVCIEKKTQSSVLIFISFIFTLAADINLLLKDSYFAGVCLFFIVQQLHMFNICSKEKYIKVMSAGIFGGLLIYMLYYAVFGVHDRVVPAAAVYFTTFVFNNIMLCTKRCRERFHKLYRLGMLLFVMCDINVGFFNIAYYTDIVISNKFYFVASAAMWGFYLPGQLLIALYGAEQKISVKTAQ